MDARGMEIVDAVILHCVLRAGGKWVRLRVTAQHPLLPLVSNGLSVHPG